MPDTTILDESDQDPRVTNWCVLVMSSSGFAAYPLPVTGELVIGRSVDADIQLADPRASRKHARLCVAEQVTIEDLSSGNGTRVRGSLIAPLTPVSIEPGEPVVIGGTCLMVDRHQGSAAEIGVWSHAMFESRAGDLCGRARSDGVSFGIGRIRIDQAIHWTQVVPLLVATIRQPHLIALYGPGEYEVLFRDTEPEEAKRIVGDVLERLAKAGHLARAAVSWFPVDGRTVDALVAHSAAQIRVEVSGLRLGEVGEIKESAALAMKKLYDTAGRAAAGTINVLIAGETGVGKEVLAQAIHRLSPRRDAHLLCLNCAGFSETLLESELFGYEKGAFTGAIRSKIGLLETANGGTVFLDEVGELPPVIQAKLLRVIDRREVIPVGGLKARPIDVRFVSATNRNLELECEQNRFRQDLLFRLNGICLEIPPLRERRVDISVLCQNFLLAAAINSNWKTPPTISPAALRLLTDYHWPGNIRELKNMMDRAVVLCDGSTIEPQHLPLDKLQASAGDGRLRVTAPPSLDSLTESITLPPTFPPDSDDADLQRRRIIEALAACAGNQSRAAKLLGIPRRTFVDRLRTYGIPRPQKL